MDPSHLKMTKQKKTKKAIIPPSVMINQPNLRQILLDKLMKHRKTQKKKEPDILSNNFDEQCMFPEQAPVVEIKPQETHMSTVSHDKPYGVLKNGLKPTFKTWNKTQKNNVATIGTTESVNRCIHPVETIQPEIRPPERVPEPVPIEVSPSLSEPVPVEVAPTEVTTVETRVPIKVGKSKKNKTVQILIPCHQTRKNRTEQYDTYRKTSLSTVKNYLKNRKLIKVGSTAPTNLIRQIYENAKAYGDVVNENKQNLLYNFEADETLE